MKSANEIANNVFRRRDEYLSQRKQRKIIFQRISAIIPICVVVVLMLTTLGTCYAFAAGFGIVDDFLNFFEGRSERVLSASQQAHIEEAVAEVGESITCNDVTVTLKSAYADGSLAYILLDVEAPESVSLDAYGLHFDTAARELLRGNNPKKYLNTTGFGTADIIVADNDGNENTTTIMLRVNTLRLPGSQFSFADGYTRTLILDSLSAYEETYPYTQYTIADGTWKFNIDFVDVNQGEKELLSTPTQMQAIRGCSTDGMPVTVNSIRMQGLGLTFYYDVNAGDTPEAGTFGPVQIQMKDGTRIDAHSNMSLSLGKESGSDYICSYIAESPIVFADVDCIIINNELIIPFELAG